MGPWIMVLLAVVLAACGPSAPETADAPSPADAAPAPDAASAPGAVPSGAATPTVLAGAAPAPFATVALVGGGQLDGGDLAGRDLALWFWAPW